MKIAYKFLSLAVFSLLILSACDNFSWSSVSVGEPEKAMMEDKEMMEGETPAVDESSSKQADCSMLKSAVQQEDCESQVNELIARIIQSEAVQTFDLELCGKLPSFFAEQCETAVEASGVKGPVSEDDMAMYSEALNPVFPQPEEGAEADSPAIPVYDKSKCAELQTPGYQAYCEGQIDLIMERIKLDQIFEDGDVEDCEQFTDEDLKTDCEGYFGVIVAPPVPAEPPVVPEETSPDSDSFEAEAL
jgi:hypothetical protein